jgi:hypothetical protein
MSICKASTRYSRARKERSCSIFEMSHSLGGKPWSFWRASSQQVLESLTARNMFARGSMRKTMVNDDYAVAHCAAGETAFQVCS